MKLKQHLKSLNKIIIGAGLISVCSVSHAIELNFKQTVAMVLQNNPELQIEAHKVDEARAILDVANSKRYPELRFNYTAARTDSALAVFTIKAWQRDVSFGDIGFAEAPPAPGATIDTKPKALNRPGYRNDFNPSIQLVVPVWNGGKISNNQERAKAFLEMSKSSSLSVQQKLIEMAYLCYEGIHTARAYIKMTQKALESAQLVVETSKNLYNQGVIVKSDYLLAQVNLAQAELDLKQAKNQERNALDNLKTLLNLPLTETLTVAERENLHLADVDLYSLQQQAVASNHHLNAIRNNITVNEKQLEIVKSDYYPSINLYLRRDWHNETFTSLENTDVSLAAIASWKITDFGGTDGAVKRCTAILNQEKARLEAETNKVRLEIQTAYRNYHVASENEVIQKLAITQAEEANRLSQMQYENGIQTLSQLIANQTLLNKARAQHLKAIYETNAQKAKLLVATGALDVNYVSQINQP